MIWKGHSFFAHQGLHRMLLTLVFGYADIRVYHSLRYLALRKGRCPPRRGTLAVRVYVVGIEKQVLPADLEPMHFIVGTCRTGKDDTGGGQTLDDLRGAKGCGGLGQAPKAAANPPLWLNPPGGGEPPPLVSHGYVCGCTESLCVKAPGFLMLLKYTKLSGFLT